MMITMTRDVTESRSQPISASVDDDNYDQGCDGVTQPANICIRWMRISCAKSVGCRFVARYKLPAIITTAIQLSYLKLNSCSEKLK